MKQTKKERRGNTWYKEKAGKIKLLLAGVIGIAAAIWILYYYVHFISYDEYKQYLSTYSYEEGVEFTSVYESESSVKGMDLAEENTNLKLYVNSKTGEIAIYDKRNKETIYSNPLDADEDFVANETNKNYLKSQIIVEYFNKSRAMGIYDTYSMAVARGQIKLEKIRDGIRFVYDLGDYSKASTGIVPVFITEEKLEEIKGKVSEGDATALGRYYMKSGRPDGMLELNGASRKNQRTIKKIEELLAGAGFTEEDYGAMMELAGEEVEESISFLIPLEYRLEEDGLRVSIPAKGIKEYGQGKIFRIQLLRYLGAPGEEEKGYMVVPNGAGSLIYFNNGKYHTADYSQYTYEIDPLAASPTKLENTEKVRLGLYGICRENSSILATIEDGAALSYITAGVSGRFSSYNYAYTTFVVRGYDILSMFGTTGREADLPVVVKDMYDTNFSMKYSFLTKEYKGYDGLANYYRERLIAKGTLTPNVQAENTQTEDIPFYYDVIGGIKKTKHLMGSKYLGTEAITTFEEAGKISDDLFKNGIQNQVMNYQGWFNGGYYHDVANKISILKKLGGKKGLEALSKKVEDNGGTFFGDAAFQRVSYVSKRYNKNYETSKYYGAGYIAYSAGIDPTSFRNMYHGGYLEKGELLLSPKFLPRYVDSFLNKIDKINISGISLRDLGNELHSDHKRSEVLHREDALDIVTEQLARLGNSGKKLLVSGGNEYVFAFTKDIVNVPLKGNDYFIIDEHIPLLQMILHGSINYSGGHINYNNDIDESNLILTLLEYGASPHYVFTWDSANEMKYTGLNTNYSTGYDIWKEQAVSLYHKINGELSKVSGEAIVKHEILESGVRKVTYSNGIIFYLNYSERTIEEDGYQIEPKQYVVGKES